MGATRFARMIVALLIAGHTWANETAAPTTENKVSATAAEHRLQLDFNGNSFSGPAWDRLTAIRERAEKESWQFRMVGTSVINHGDTPDWYNCFPIESLIAQVLEKINSRGSVTGVQNDAS